MWKLIAFGELLVAAIMTVLSLFAQLRTEAAKRREMSAIDMARDERTLRMDAEKREVDLLVASSERLRSLSQLYFGMGTPERRRANSNADIVAQLMRGERVMPTRETGEA